MIHGEWEVVGRRVFRGHEPGERFVASLREGQAGRAIARGDLVLLEQFEPRVPNGWCLPKGWLEE